MRKLLCIILATILCLSIAACAPMSAPEEAPVDTTEVTQDGSGETPSDDAVNEGGSSENGASDEISSIANFRDLGGIETQDGTVVKPHKLLRAAKLSEMSEEDKETLLSVYHLKNDIDMRYSYEVNSDPDPEMPGVEYISLSVIPETDFATENEEASREDADEASSEEDGAEEEVVYNSPHVKEAEMLLTYGADIREMIGGMYVLIVTDEHSIDCWKTFFDVLLSTEDGATLYHCSAGKDRTGVATALILSALNVDRDTIISEYMLTNVLMAEEIENDIKLAETDTDDPVILEGIYYMRAVDESYIQGMFDAVDSVYGSMDNFLKEQIGLTDDDFTKLKELYTEG